MWLFVSVVTVLLMMFVMICVIICVCCCIRICGCVFVYGCSFRRWDGLWYGAKGGGSSRHRWYGGEEVGEASGFEIFGRFEFGGSGTVDGSGGLEGGWGWER